MDASAEPARKGHGWVPCVLCSLELSHIWATQFPAHQCTVPCDQGPFPAHQCIIPCGQRRFPARLITTVWRERQPWCVRGFGKFGTIFLLLLLSSVDSAPPTCAMSTATAHTHICIYIHIYNHYCVHKTIPKLQFLYFIAATSFSRPALPLSPPATTPLGRDVHSDGDVSFPSAERRDLPPQAAGGGQVPTPPPVHRKQKPVRAPRPRFSNGKCPLLETPQMGCGVASCEQGA